MTQSWVKQTVKLKENHTWRSKPGYNIFVVDRGAVQMYYPERWVVKPASDCIKFHDREPPDENCVLGLSYLRLPPHIDYSGLPLSQLLQTATKDDRRNLRLSGKVIQLQRSHLEIAWTEARFIDPKLQKEAIAYFALARGARLQCLLTFDFWPGDFLWARPVWDEVLRSIQLGNYLQDPTAGERLH
jgi:hypothetical protein